MLGTSFSVDFASYHIFFLLLFCRLLKEIVSSEKIRERGKWILIFFHSHRLFSSPSPSEATQENPFFSTQQLYTKLNISRRFSSKFNFTVMNEPNYWYQSIKTIPDENLSSKAFMRFYTWLAFESLHFDGVTRRGCRIKKLFTLSDLRIIPEHDEILPHTW